MADEFVTWEKLHEWLDLTRNEIISTIDKHMDQQDMVCDLKMGKMSDRVSAVETENKRVVIEKRKWTTIVYSAVFTAIVSGASSLLVIYFAFRFWGVT